MMLPVPEHAANAAGKRPAATSVKVRAQMSAQRRRDTAIELRLRRLLHRNGLRYRVDHPPIPGLRRRGDIVFTAARVCVFVDGCFWHSCPAHATRPKANAAWWAQKLERNVARDRETDQKLESEGWTVVRVWEHEDPAVVAASITRLVHTVRSNTRCASRPTTPR